MLEKRIILAKVEFTKKEVLKLVKMESHDVIIAGINRKRQLICKTGMNRVPDAGIYEY